MPGRRFYFGDDLGAGGVKSPAPQAGFAERLEHRVRLRSCVALDLPSAVLIGAFTRVSPKVGGRLPSDGKLDAQAVVGHADRKLGINLRGRQRAMGGSQIEMVRACEEYPPD